MREPRTLTVRPSLGWCLVGGALGALISAAVFHLAGALWAGEAAAPAVVGGWIVEDPQRAAVVGYLLHTLIALAAAPLVGLVGWSMLPGAPKSLPGATLKGACVGAVVFVLGGVILLVGGVLGGAAWVGAAGWLVLAAASLAYGLSVALTAWAAQGLSVLDTLGWNALGKQGEQGGST